jgi:hypothetical protein
MTRIVDILNEKELEAIQNGFEPKDMLLVIKETLIDRDPAIVPYLMELENILKDPTGNDPRGDLAKAIEKIREQKNPAIEPQLKQIEAILAKFPGPSPTSPYLDDDLAIDDKERILIAVLAARGMNYFLALHFYVALALQPPPGQKQAKRLEVSEILKILRLIGSYSGLPVYSQSILVFEQTLLVLKEACAARSPPKVPDINNRLRTKFAEWSQPKQMVTT